MIIPMPCRQAFLAQKNLTIRASNRIIHASAVVSALWLPKPRTRPPTSYYTTQTRHYSSSRDTNHHVNWATEIVRSSQNSTSNQEKQVEIESTISALSLTRYLRSTSSPYNEKPLYPPSLSSGKLERNLVSGSLFHPAKIPHNPPVFTRKLTREDGSKTAHVIAFFYLGTHLCGHPGFIHGGIHFILFDNIFARCAGVVVTSGSVMTANTNIDYRKPALPDRLYVVRAEVEKVEGKKVWLRGSIRSLPGDPELRNMSLGREIAEDDEVSGEEEQGVLVAEATALFIEPKFAGGAKGSDGLWRND